jgi:RNA polymerase sigma-70 factor (ECF subfamily)
MDLSTAARAIAMTHNQVKVVPTFEELYVLEYPGLFAVATALTGDRHESEDVVQDTMVRAFLHWSRVQRLERPGAWCHRVLTNLCRSLWRRRRTRARFQAGHRPNDVGHLDLTADVIDFWQVVRTLPTRQRSAVALYYAADRSTADVAAILDVPEGTIRSDLTRARAILARELGIGDGH